MTIKLNRPTDAVILRRNRIPSAYRGIYDRAVSGQSLRAAVNAQCLECVYWKKDEIRNCPDAACPLYAVRPYQNFPKTACNSQDMTVESNKTVKGCL
jgi:hypothetical protein